MAEKLCVTKDGLTQFLSSIIKEEVQSKAQKRRQDKIKAARNIHINLHTFGKGKDSKSEDTDGTPSPLKRIRGKSPAKNDFVKAIRQMKEEEYLKSHGLRLRRKSLTLQNNTKLLSVSLSKSKLREFRKRRKAKKLHLSEGYLQSQLEGMHSERIDHHQAPDLLDILRIDPMSSLTTRNKLMKKYGLLPSNKEIQRRREKTLFIQHQKRMNDFKKLQRSINRKYISNKNKMIQPNKRRQLSLRKLNEDLKITEELKKHLIKTKKIAQKKNGFFYNLKYRKAHDDVKKSGVLHLDGFSTHRSKVFKEEARCHSKVSTFSQRDLSHKGFRISRKDLISPIVRRSLFQSEIGHNERSEIKMSVL